MKSQLDIIRKRAYARSYVILKDAKVPIYTVMSKLEVSEILASILNMNHDAMQEYMDEKR